MILQIIQVVQYLFIRNSKVKPLSGGELSFNEYNYLQVSRLFFFWLFLKWNLTASFPGLEIILYRCSFFWNSWALQRCSITRPALTLDAVGRHLSSDARENLRNRLTVEHLRFFVANKEIKVGVFWLRALCMSESSLKVFLVLIILIFNFLYSTLRSRRG